MRIVARLLFLVAIGVVGFAFWAWLRPKPSAPVQPSSDDPKTLQSVTLTGPSLEQIHVTVATARPLYRTLALSGTLRLDPDRSAVVSARVAGMVDRYLVRIGQRVTAGETVVVLDSVEVARAQGAYTSALSALATAERNLVREQALARMGAFSQEPVEESAMQQAEAEAALLEARSHLNLARRADIRMQAMFTEGVVSAKDAEQSRAERLEAEARLQAATRVAATRRIRLSRETAVHKGSLLNARVLQQLEGEVAAKAQDVQQAGQALNALKVEPGTSGLVEYRSPIDGMVVERPATRGQAVDASAPLLTVVDADGVWAVLEVYEQDLSYLARGAAVTVVGPNKQTVQGQVAFVTPRVDTESRTAQAWVRLNHVPAALHPGAFVRADVQVPAGHPGIAVPEGAVQREENHTVVYLQTHPGTFVRRDVTVGEPMTGGMEVRMGLSPGDRVVTEGSFVVKSAFLKETLEGD